MKTKTRKSGYYWVIRIGTEDKMEPSEYNHTDNYWTVLGYKHKYFDRDLRYISPTPITIPKKK